MTPLVEWHVYLVATLVGVAAAVTAGVIWIRARLRKARSRQSP